MRVKLRFEFGTMLQLGPGKAELLEQIAQGGGTYALSDEERRLVHEGFAELDRGEVASEEQVRAVFDKYRA